ncbi:MAG TPA: AAA family ATPase [Solirubrobacteraceae bacterium]|nr:AAA family ATPase [Solirubrobacteraceae bacterium]
MPEALSTRERARIQLCGRLSIEVDGDELAHRLRGRQVPLLFAYMVLGRNRAMSRDELAEALWPDSAPRSQDGALRTLLSRLRSVLGSGAVVGRDEVALVLPEPAWIDVEAAAAQLPRAAEALERGDARAAWALAQVPLNIAGRGLLPGLQASWVEPRRRELAELRLEALEVIGRAGLELGGTQLGSVERAGRALIELEPFRESGYVLLMEALAAQGNLAEAVRVFERLRRLLRDDLGTVPSPEAIGVHERLLGAGGSPGRAVRASDEPRSKGPERTELELPASLRALAQDTLVGRDAELAAIRAWWGTAGERMLLLAGEPGMGKSRLQAELAAEVHRGGVIVLAGHAPDEALVPYQPLLEAIGRFAFGAPLAELRAAVQRSGEAGADLARLVPELRRRLPELPAPRASDPDTDRYRLFEAVADLLGWIAASGQLLIVLDDLHWADRPTLLMLRHLLRSPQAAGLRILGAYRTGEPGAAGLTAMVAPLRREGLVRGLDIGGLDRDASVELLRLRAGGTPSAALQRALYEETEGNPLFLSELVRHLQECGIPPLQAGLGDLRAVGLPDDVRALISRRLERLSADGLEWLRGAAVIGREFDASLLEAVLGFDEDRFLEALEEALEARLIAEAPGGRPGEARYMFSHALVRETLYAGTSAPRRLRTHHRVGLALEGRAAARAAPDGTGPLAPTDGEIAALAHHFTRAGDARDPERAITYALAAGEQATQMLAHEEAAEHYGRALEVLDRTDGLGAGRERRLALLLELGEARLRGGDRVEAWPAFREAAALALELGDREALIRAAIEASRRFIQPPGLVEHDLIELLDLALAQTAGERSVTRVWLLARLCTALYFTPRRGETRRLSAEATAIAAELGDPEAAALAAGARRRAWWGPGQLERRLADSTMLLRSAREAGNVELILQGHLWLVLDLLEAGDRAAVEAQIDAFALEAEPLRQPRLVWNVLTWRAMLALLDGRLADAERLSAQALADGIRIEGRAASQYHVMQMLAIRSEQGRAAEMSAVLADILRETEGRVTWRAGAAIHHLDAGQRERARAELEALVGPGAPEIPSDGEWLGATVLLGETASALGDAERAATLYERLEPYADTVLVLGVGAVCWGSVSLCLGRLALACGRTDPALAHLERALRANTALGARIQVATTQLELARALGASERARDLVAAAARTAQELALPRVARMAEALAARVG